MPPETPPKGYRDMHARHDCAQEGAVQFVLKTIVASTNPGHVGHRTWIKACDAGGCPYRSDDGRSCESTVLVKNGATWAKKCLADEISRGLLKSK